jgi:hypothetical protein
LYGMPGATLPVSDISTKSDASSASASSSRTCSGSACSLLMGAPAAAAAAPPLAAAAQCGGAAVAVGRAGADQVAAGVAAGWREASDAREGRPPWCHRLQGFLACWASPLGQDSACGGSFRLQDGRIGTHGTRCARARPMERRSG